MYLWTILFLFKIKRKKKDTYMDLNAIANSEDGSHCFLSFFLLEESNIIWLCSIFKMRKEVNKEDINGKRGVPISVGSQTSKD